MILYVKNRRFYKSAVIGIVFGIVLVWLFIWNVMNVINISIRYDGDRNYAFVTTGQTVYTRMKDEEFSQRRQLPGTVYIKKSNLI